MKKNSKYNGHCEEQHAMRQSHDFLFHITRLLRYTRNDDRILIAKNLHNSTMILSFDRLMKHLKYPIIALIILINSSCGFTSLYGENNITKNDDTIVNIRKTTVKYDKLANPYDKVGQKLYFSIKKELFNEMDKSDYARYVIHITEIKTISNAASINMNDDIKYYNVKLVVKYNIYDNLLNKEIFNGTARNFSGYRASDPYPNYVLEQDGIDNIIDEIAKEIAVNIVNLY